MLLISCALDSGYVVSPGRSTRSIEGTLGCCTSMTKILSWTTPEPDPEEAGFVCWLNTSSSFMRSCTCLKPVAIGISVVLPILAPVCASWTLRVAALLAFTDRRSRTCIARRVQNLFWQGNTGSMASCSRIVLFPALSSPSTTIAGGFQPSRASARRSRRGSSTAKNLDSELDMSGEDCNKGDFGGSSSLFAASTSSSSPLLTSLSSPSSMSHSGVDVTSSLTFSEAASLEGCLLVKPALFVLFLFLFLFFFIWC
mmetsp:Transcript_12006/g.29113  ORF Transcript_12006/g.29113 Transcript_12006/m.29113 type:complete len:255 (-) Transcript_12006:693-1457(-)